jgi:protease-4
MKPGIIFSSLRAFFIALFATIGVSFGLVVLIIMVGSISSQDSEDVESSYSVEILPNAQGIRKTVSKKSPAILELNISGVIGGRDLNAETVREILVESREGNLKNDRVKAILLRINSPGGTVTDADDIYRSLMAYKKQYGVPIFAYIDGLCASGGLYVASAADLIYASEASVIGSVGVITPPFFNLSNLLEKVGIRSMTLFSGKGKDDLSSVRPWKEGEEQNLKELIAVFYDQFVDIVTKSRPKISKEKLVDDFGAKIYPSIQALEYGFIDGTGISRNEVLNLLLKEIAIEDDYYQVVQLKKSNWLNHLLESKMGPQSEVVHRIELPGMLDPKLQGQFLYLWHPH